MNKCPRCGGESDRPLKMVCKACGVELNELRIGQLTVQKLKRAESSTMADGPVLTTDDEYRFIAFQATWAELDLETYHWLRV